MAESKEKGGKKEVKKEAKMFEGMAGVIILLLAALVFSIYNRAAERSANKNQIVAPTSVTPYNN